MLHARTDRGGCPLQRRRPDGSRQWPQAEVPFGVEGLLGGAYLVIGQPERWVEWCRAQLARGRDTHTITRATLVFALTIAGSGDEAMAAANGLIDAAEATRNPCVLSFALAAYGFAFRDADPVRARERPAPGPGDRSRQRQPLQRDRPGGQSGPPRGRARRPAGRARLLHCWRSATSTTRATRATSAARWLSSPPFSTGSDATNQRPPSPGSPPAPHRGVVTPRSSTAIAHLREVLGDQTYESLARKGETMTTAAMATYALRPNRPGPSRTERVSK